MNSPRVSGEPSPLQVWFSTIRPRTLVASLAPVCVGSALAWTQDSFRLDSFSASLLGALAIQTVVNFHNDLKDYEKGADTDERLGPPRACQMGWLTKAQLKKAIGLSLLIGALAGLYLVWLTGWPLLAVGVLGVVSAFAYTGGPYPLAYVGIAEVFVLVFFGFAAVVGTVFAHGAQISPEAWWLGGAIGAASNTLLVVNNLRDREGDRKVGKRTTAVRFGGQFARFQYAAYWTAAFWCTVAAARMDHPGLYFSLVLAIPTFLAAQRVFRTDGKALNHELAAAGRLHAFLGILLTMGLVLCG